MITRQGRVEVLNDVECREFPWHPKPVLELTDSNAVQLNEGPCLVLFVGMDGASLLGQQSLCPGEGGWLSCQLGSSWPRGWGAASGDDSVPGKGCHFHFQFPSLCAHSEERELTVEAP